MKASSRDVLKLVEITRGLCTCFMSMEMSSPSSPDLSTMDCGIDSILGTDLGGPVSLHQ